MSDPPGELREARIFWGIWGGSLLLHGLPVVLSEHPPMQDYPNHLAIVATLARKHADPAWGQHFVDRLGLQPQSLFYALALLLSGALGAAGACKALVLAYLALTPLAFRAVLLALGVRNRWAALAIFPLLFSDSYLLGFLPWLLSLPLALATLALAIHLARRPAPLLPGLAALAILGGLLWLAHPLALGLLLLTAVAVVPFQGERPPTLASLGALAPAALLLAWSAAEAPDLATTGIELSAAFKGKYLLLAPLLMAEASRGTSFWIAALALLLVVGLALLRAMRTAREVSPGEPGWVALRGSVAPGVMVLFLTYLGLPFGQGPAIWLDSRVVGWTWWVLLLALGRWIAVERLGRVALGVLIGASWWCVVRGHLAFAKEAAPLLRVLEQAPSGGRLLPLMEARESSAFQPFYARSGEVPFFSLFAHAGSLYHARHGGESPFLTFHATLDWVPLGLREARYGRLSIAGPFQPERTLRQTRELGLEFDLVLVRGDGSLARKLAAQGPPLASDGPWALYRGGTP